MLSHYERFARRKKYFTFKKEELYPLLAISALAGFMFSLRHPGEAFRLIAWAWYFVVSVLLCTVSFFSRVALQKIAGLERGYYVQFKVWWEATIVSLVVSLLSFGYAPILVMGGTRSSFMVRHRIGKFAYGYSFEENANIANWGMIANLILATIFALFLFMFPESYIFGTGLAINLIMAFSMHLPLPNLDGMQIYFGSRALYWTSWVAYFFVTLLLLSQTKVGLILVIVLGTIAGVASILWRA